MSVRVKICGITNLTDALAAVEAGADALGFMFFTGSKRYITPAEARKLTLQLPPFILRVGVFVNPSQEEVTEAIGTAGINALQFHGEETPGYCASFSLPVIKAIAIRDASSLDALQQYSPSAFLLDAYVPGERGGTGETFNWKLALNAKTLGKPIILAGGLTPKNVGPAISEVAPYGVDVSSGVESAPGKKDPKKIEDFIRAAKAA
jgi:phosphoribosylanthranilate isomerase